MTLTPIFDTSAVIDLSKRDSEDHVSNRLKSLVPRRGWPLSHVTVLELFYGLRLGGKERLVDSLKAVTVASQLSRRKVLLYPIPFMERELFEIRNAGHESSRENLSRWLGKAIGPNFEGHFISGRADVAHLEKIEALFVMGRKGYVSFFEQFLDRAHPQWRAERGRSGSALPEKERERLKHTTPVDRWKRDCAKCLLECMRVRPTLSAINFISDRCDAYFTYTVSVLRDTMMTSYRFEENWNDFNDGMQLLYLSRPSNCLVTEDVGLRRRAKKSSQACRILTIEEFVSAKSPTECLVEESPSHEVVR